MFDERKEKSRREAGRSSGFIFRKEHVKKDAENRDMTGLLQRKTREERKQLFSETFHKENAYGHISLGASQRSELGLVVSGKQEYHESPAKENERVLDLNRSKRQDRNIQGEIQTNSHKERESAIGLFSGKRTTENQMLAKLKEYEQTKGNDQLEKQLPFLSLEKDRREKVRLNALWQEAKEQGQTERAKKLELAGLELATQITQKEQLEKEFRQELGDQLRELREHPKHSREDMLQRLWKKAAQALDGAEEEGNDESEGNDKNGRNIGNEGNNGDWRNNGDKRNDETGEDIVREAAATLEDSER